MISRERSVAVLALVLGVAAAGRARAQDAAPAKDAGAAKDAAAVTSTASPGALAPEGAAPNGFTPRLAQAVFPAIVKVYGAGGFRGIPAYGTGVVIDASGIVATSWSIALTTETLHVVTDTGQKLPAKILKADVRHGLALLEVEGADKLGAIPLASALPAAGELVYAVGNAFDDAAGDEKCAVVGGIVSAVASLDVRVGIEDGPALGEVIITDAPNNPGTQGGALVSRDGKLLGILGRIVESKSTNTQINYAVPATTVRALLASTQGGPELPSPPARVQPAAVETGIRLLDAHLMRSPPAYVERVLAGSPAERAGVKPDDLIFRMDGHVVRSCQKLEDMLREHAPGDRVKLVLKRGESMVEVELELAARKES